MKKDIFKIIILHILIMTAYLSITDYMFVVRKESDPIGSGILQWICVLMHFIVTAIIVGILNKNATDKTGNRRKILLHLSAIIVLWVINIFLIDNIVWGFLWSLRK